MMNQKIKRLMGFFIFLMSFVLYSSEQEKKYQFVFVEKGSNGDLIALDQPIIITENQLQNVGLMEDLVRFDQTSQINGSIPISVEDQYLKKNVRRIFQEDILPVITKFISIKNRNQCNYSKIIALIHYIKVNEKDYDYEKLKNALTVIDYLQVSLVVKRAFANAAYDKMPDYLAKKAKRALPQKIVLRQSIDSEKNYKKAYKEVYESAQAQEQDFIDKIIYEQSLISLRDLPKDLVEANDFINKGLRSLDGINNVIQSEYEKDPFNFIYFRKNFNFKQNFIQEVDPLDFLVSELMQKGIKNCRFIIYLDKDKLSENAKKICKKINKPIAKSKFSKKFENLKEADLIPNYSLRSLKMSVSQILDSPGFKGLGFFSLVGLHAWLHGSSIVFFQIK